MRREARRRFDRRAMHRTMHAYEYVYYRAIASLPLRAVPFRLRVNLLSLRPSQRGSTTRDSPVRRRRVSSSTSLIGQPFAIAHLSMSV